MIENQIPIPEDAIPIRITLPKEPPFGKLDIGQSFLWDYKVVTVEWELQTDVIKHLPKLFSCSIANVKDGTATVRIWRTK